MGRKDTESTDVPEDGGETEVSIVASILIPSEGTPLPSGKTGVVFRVNWAPSGTYYEITVGLDKSRWREVAPRSDEGEEMVDDTAESDSLASAG